MKTRMTSVDVATECACLRALDCVGMRVANVYDINPRTYLIKLARSGGETGQAQKVMLLIESATRFHATKFVRDKSATPSNFTVKLRKHLRSRRLEAVTQVGMDRVVELQFGSGEAAHHLIIELYAQGNIILTDADRNIMTLLRSYKDEAKGVSITANQLYQPLVGQPFEPFTRDALEAALREAHAKQPAGTPKQVVGKVMPYGPALAEHCLRASGLAGVAAVDDSMLAPAAVDALVAALQPVHAWLEGLHGADCSPQPGVITMKPASEVAAPDNPLVNDEFLPMRLAEYKEPAERKEFVTFDEAMDEFFSKFEEQRAAVQVLAQKKAVMSKLDKIKLDQDRRVEELAGKALAEDRRAQLIEYNLAEVDGAINAVNEALAAGMDWSELRALIHAEAKAGNPVAGLIHEMNLERNTVALLLSNTLDDADEEEMTAACDVVEVDLGLTAHANAAQYFAARKRSAAKQEKTMAAAKTVMKQAERRADRDAARVAAPARIVAACTLHWFEKFDWFLSSENCLVLCARDKPQGDLLVRRYMVADDAFVHSDVQGAPCCVVKSLTGPLLPGEVHITGTKHFLPPSQLIMGFGLLFEVAPECVEAHRGERRVRSDTNAAGPPPDMLSTAQDQAADAATAATEEESTALPDDADNDGDGDDGNDGRSDELAMFMDSAPRVLSVGTQAEPLREAPGVGRHTPPAEEATTEATTDATSPPLPARQGGGYLSAKQRRMLKKGKGAANGWTDDGGGDDGDAGSAAPPPSGDAADAPPAPESVGSGKGGLLPQKETLRGKKGKLKKLKGKYADQDEEDRALAIQLLGAAGKARPEPPTPAEGGGGRSGRANAIQHSTGAARPRPATERAPATESDYSDTPIEVSLAALDTFTGCPTTEDTILCCVPVCAPYSVLHAYKYKVKLTPGSQKKGRAAREAMNAFTYSKDATATEKACIAEVKDPELIPPMLANVKISTPGLEKIKSAARNEKKKGKN